MTNDAARKPEDAAGQGGPAWQAAVADGMDVSLLDYLLSLTPEERLVRHDQALELVLALREAGKRHYGFDPRNPDAPAEEPFGNA